MVTLYTTNCPKCKVLETKLNQSGIEFEVCDNEDVMIQKGFMSAPMLDVDGNVMDFMEAIGWIRERG